MAALLGVALLPLALATPASAATLTSTSYTASNTLTGTAGVRNDWGFTTASSATLSKVTMGMPTGTSGGNRYLALGGANGNNASTPDSTFNSVTGDIDIRAKVSLSNWNASGYQALLTKWGATGSQSYIFRVDSGGILGLYWSTNGSDAPQSSSSTSLGFVNKTTHWVRATLQVNNGASGSTTNFYTSDDGTTWTQLGSSIVNSGVTSIYDGTYRDEVGSYNNTTGSLTGKIYYADVRNSIGANGVATNCSSAGVVNCFNPNNDAIGGSSWASSSATGETWTVNRTGSNLPADIASDLSVAKVTGLPIGGTANYRSIDNVATYNLPSATSIASGIAISVGLMGFTNTSTAGSYTSTVTTYDNSGTPAAIDTATTAALAITGNTISTAFGAIPDYTAPTANASVNVDPVGTAIYGTTMYVADTYTNVILKVNMTTGMSTRFAGSSGLVGYAGDGGQATSAVLNAPRQIATDSAGNLYIAETGSNRIRKVNVSTGIITTVAGNGTAGSAGDGSAATSANLNTPNGVAVEANGDIYIADSNNNKIRKVDHTTGYISTVAGTGTASFSGDGGAATSATLNAPLRVDLDGNGDVYISDSTNNEVRKLTLSAGNISRFAGTGTAGFSGDSAAATSAQLSYPYGVAFAANGDAYIMDSSSHRIRKVTAATGFISTVAGNGTFAYGGDGGAATSATIWAPRGPSIDSNGNLYFADYGNSRIREINTSGTISTYLGSGIDTDSGDGGPASAAEFFSPVQMATDSSGNMYVADANNNRIRKIDQWGIVTTVAGAGSRASYGYSGDGAAATAALLNGPQGVAVASNGDLYISDNGNGVIRKVDHVTGYISTFVTLSSPARLAFNPVTGDLYVVRLNNCLVTKVTMAGVQSTVVGTGTCGYNLATATDPTTVQLNAPRDIAFKPNGDLYIADLSNSLVRKVDGVTGATSVVAGGGASSANNVAASSALMTGARGLAIDSLGNIFVTEDQSCYDVRKFTDGGPIVTVAGHSSYGNSGDGGVATSAAFTNNAYLAIMRGQLYIANGQTNTIRKVADIAPMAPNVNADSMSVAMNTPLTYPVESNDWDQDGAMDPNSVAITTAPAHGTAVVNTVQGSITNVTYTPTTSYTGADSFVYQACDSTLVLCGSATVSITVGSNQVTTVVGGLTEGLGTNIGFTPARATRFKNYIFYSDDTYNVIRRYDIYSQQSVTVAGNGTVGATNSTGPASAFYNPEGLAITPAGQVYIADNTNNLVRTLNTDGTVSTLSAGVTQPLGLTLGIDGTLYATSGNSIKKWTGSIWVTFAGTGATGSSGDGGPATSALLTSPQGLYAAPTGDIYIADVTTCTVRKVNSAGIINAVAGTAGTCSFSGDGAAATSATLNSPRGMAMDSAGNLLIADYNNNKIRKVDTSGNLTSVAIAGITLNSPLDVVAGTSTDFYVLNYGSGRGIYVNTSGAATYVLGTGSDRSYGGDGLSALATQISPAAAGAALLVDNTGNIYVGEGANATIGPDRIRKVSASSGLVSSVVTSVNPDGAAFDGSGNLVYSDELHCRIYRLNADFSTTLLAGTGTCSTTGNGGQATAATLNNPVGIAYDMSGNLYEAELSGNVVRRITPGGIISNFAGTGTAGLAGDGGAATAAQLNSPRAVAVDRTGNLLINDVNNSRVRMVDTQGTITTFAGLSGGFSGDGGLATAAKLANTSGIAIDSANNVYLSDQNNRVRMIDGSGVISTVVGGSACSLVDNATYLSSTLCGAGAIALDNSGNLYISEVTNHRIRKAAALASTATDNLASASWSVVPGESGHANLREQFVATPSATVTSSKLTFTMPTGIAGTPSVVSAYGVSGTVTSSLSGTTLTLSFPSQSLTAGVAVSFAVEGWTNGGANGAYDSNVTLYDSAGSTAIGWARSNVVNISSAGAPAASDPGYASVWMPSTTVTPAASSISINVDPAATPIAAASMTVTTGGNLNANSLGLGATTLTRNATPFSTFGAVSTGIATGVATASFGADTWGSSATTTSGTVQGGAASGNYVGNTPSQQTFVAGANATNTYTLSARAKVDWLLPAGTYTSTLTYGLSPGT